MNILLRLHIVQLLVISVLADEFVVGAPLHYLSLVEHAYLVGILDGGESVGYRHGGARLHQSFQSVLHESLALCVESRCCLVEDEYRRILEYGSRYAHSLSLSAGEARSPILVS